MSALFMLSFLCAGDKPMSYPWQVVVLSVHLLLHVFSPCCYYPYSSSKYNSASLPHRREKKKRGKLIFCLTRVVSDKWRSTTTAGTLSIIGYFAICLYLKYK